MTIQALPTIPTEAAANTLFNKEKRINSFYDQTFTFGTDAAATALATLRPVGLNSSTGKFGIWMAPDPSVTTITLTGATGGTFKLIVNGAVSNDIAYNATAATVAAVIRGMGYLATVTLGSLIYTITWTDPLLVATLPTITADLTDITGDDAASATPTPGTATPIDPTILNISLGTDVQATGGTFTITYDGNTSGAIAYDASAEDIQTAVLAIGTHAPDTVRVERIGLADITVMFDDIADLLALPTVSATLTSITGATGEDTGVTVGTVLVPDPTILTIDIGTASGGTFTITIDGVTTTAIAFNAADAALDAAILAATGIVTTTSSFVVTFGAIPQLLALPIVSGNIIELTGAGVLIATVAGTATNGQDVIKGFVYPETKTLSATEDTLVVCCVKGELFYDDILATISAGDEAALKVALKADLIAAGYVIQGLPGIN